MEARDTLEFRSRETWLQVTADDHVMRKEEWLGGITGDRMARAQPAQKKISIIILILVDNHPRDG